MDPLDIAVARGGEGERLVAMEEAALPSDRLSERQCRLAGVRYRADSVVREPGTVA